ASWSSIHEEILLLIVAYLQCFADRVSVAGVCHEWRQAVKQHVTALPPQLPWLLQPSGDHAPSTFASFLSGTSRRISLPEDVRRVHRFCGSHDGGWIAVANDFEGLYEFVNLLLPLSRDGMRIRLPSEVSLPFLTGARLPAGIRMVTLSDKPTAHNCIAAAHTVDAYPNPSIVFCRPQVDRHWIWPLMQTEPLQDTLYHRGDVFQGFYAISNRDNLYVFLPGDIDAAMNDLVMRQVVISFGPVVPYLLPAISIARYLVESRGKLLLVVRYSGSTTGTMARRTLHFKVFEMQLKPLPNGGHSASWVELDDLDGRVLFIGKGCSRAFEAGQYAGFQGGSIYFLNDAEGRTSEIYSKVVFADMGTYSMGERMIVRPDLPTPSL
ncbi:hypothetical protein BS78_03G219400, partial [Paspalum vaginatum]